MRRQLIAETIVRLLKLDGLIIIAAYMLQRVDDRFAWLFMASLVLLVWLSVAGAVALIYFLTGEDEPR